MDLFDKLALSNRRYEQLTSPRTGSKTFSLDDVVEVVGRNAILELTAMPATGSPKTVRPDAVRKMKVSLLDDGIVAIHSSPRDEYAVYRTAPTGDLSKVKIVASTHDGIRIGEVRMLIGRRTFEHYFEEDPIFEALRKLEANAS